MIVSRSSSGFTATTPSPTTASTSTVTTQCNHHNVQNYNTSNTGSGSSRRWTFSQSVLASLVIVLNLQLFLRSWNAAHCQIRLSVLETTTPMSSFSQQIDSGYLMIQNTVPSTSATDSRNNEETDKQEKSFKPVISRWEGIDDMRYFAQSYYQGQNNTYCQRIDDERANHSLVEGISTESDKSTSPQPLTMEISFGCQELYAQSGYGTGNYISLIYGLRLATAVHENVGLNFTCHDADATKASLIVPWLTGWYPPRSQTSPSRYPQVSVDEGCSPYRTTHISLMYQEMQFDFRRMAIGLVGIPGDNHPSAAFAKQYLSVGSSNYEEGRTHARQMHLDVDPNNPVFPRGSVELDDAVIHFRCGDLMDSDHPNFAFLKFASYVQDISTEARSIGIITQPFAKVANDTVDTDTSTNDTSSGSLGQERWYDASSTTKDRCRTVVSALVDYIQERFPTSTVTIHNGPTETIALAYARMIMANQTVAGISTFGVFPTVASFGTAHLHQPHGPFVNGWMFWPRRIDELAPHVSIVRDRDYIMVADLKVLWETQGAPGVVAWFQTEANASA
jgi:hypothetical protein